MRRCCQSTGITDLMATCENLHTYKICPLIKNNFSDQTTNLFCDFHLQTPIAASGDFLCWVPPAFPVHWSLCWPGDESPASSGPGAPPPGLFLSLFLPHFHSTRQSFGLFKKHTSLRHHHCSWGAELCPGVETVELTGSGHVQHGAALASPCRDPCSPHCASTSPLSPSTGL